MPTPREIALGSHTQEEYRRLVHVGFSPEQIQFLFGTPDAAAHKKYRLAFSRAQFAELLGAGPRTMKTLLKAKFTRNQAKVLIELGLV